MMADEPNDDNSIHNEEVDNISALLNDDNTVDFQLAFIAEHEDLICPEEEFLSQEPIVPHNDEAITAVVDLDHSVPLSDNFEDLPLTNAGDTGSVKTENNNHNGSLTNDMDYDSLYIMDNNSVQNDDDYKNEDDYIQQKDYKIDDEFGEYLNLNSILKNSHHSNAENKVDNDDYESKSNKQNNRLTKPITSAYYQPNMDNDNTWSNNKLDQSKSTNNNKSVNNKSCLKNSNDKLASKFSNLTYYASPNDVLDKFSSKWSKAQQFGEHHTASYEETSAEKTGEKINGVMFGSLDRLTKDSTVSFHDEKQSQKTSSDAEKIKQLEHKISLLELESSTIKKQLQETQYALNDQVSALTQAVNETTAMWRQYSAENQELRLKNEKYEHQIYDITTKLEAVNQLSLQHRSSNGPTKLPIRPGRSLDEHKPNWHDRQHFTSNVNKTHGNQLIKGDGSVKFRENTDEIYDNSEVRDDEMNNGTPRELSYKWYSDTPKYSTSEQNNEENMRHDSTEYRLTNNDVSIVISNKSKDLNNNHLRNINKESLKVQNFQDFSNARVTEDDDEFLLVPSPRNSTSQNDRNRGQLSSWKHPGEQHQRPNNLEGYQPAKVHPLIAKLALKRKRDEEISANYRSELARKYLPDASPDLKLFQETAPSLKEKYNTNKAGSIRSSEKPAQPNNRSYINNLMLRISNQDVLKPKQEFGTSGASILSRKQQQIATDHGRITKINSLPRRAISAAGNHGDYDINNADVTTSIKNGDLFRPTSALDYGQTRNQNANYESDAELKQRVNRLLRHAEPAAPMTTAIHSASKLYAAGKEQNGRQSQLSYHNTNDTSSQNNRTDQQDGLSYNKPVSIALDDVGGRVSPSRRFPQTDSNKFTDEGNLNKTVFSNSNKYESADNKWSTNHPGQSDMKTNQTGTKSLAATNSFDRSSIGARKFDHADSGLIGEEQIKFSTSQTKVNTEHSTVPLLNLKNVDNHNLSSELTSSARRYADDLIKKYISQKDQSVNNTSN